MRYSLILFLLSIFFTAAAVEDVGKWQWNYYFDHKLPAGLVVDKTLDGTLTLPDKKVLKAQKINYPASCDIDLEKFIKPTPEALATSKTHTTAAKS